MNDPVSAREIMPRWFHEDWNEHKIETEWKRQMYGHDPVLPSR